MKPNFSAHSARSLSRAHARFAESRRFMLWRRTYISASVSVTLTND